MITKLITPDLKSLPEFLKNIESKWRMKLMRRFDREKYVANKSNPDLTRSRYILSMFPYPSGRLHLGHVRIYTSSDILARYSRLLRKNERYSSNFDNVINPMGFDSFGLPAENAARERNLDPAAWTNTNIRTMKQQLDELAIYFDWREATSNPSYYKWTQDLFLKLMDAGLAYKSYARVNWDPVDKTVLADEQVDEDGRSWRSGAVIVRKNYKQWFIKVNAFVEEIYKASDIDPESWRDILAIQRHWVGEPSGSLFYLPISIHDSNKETLLVFTEHPEWFLDRDTTLIISADHWLEEVYQISKVGHICNPFTGGELKVEVSQDVTSSHATLSSESREINENALKREQVMMQAKLNGYGGYYTSNKYRDWLVSRQRFWGTPIPVIKCNNCGLVGSGRNSLPIKLPPIDRIDPMLSETTNLSEIISPIEHLAPESWLKTACPSCGLESKRECETLDTLFDSSWYFLRYATSPLSDEPYDPKKVLPVWCYIGGKEHASMHLFYARFITHFLHSKGLLKFREPFAKLMVQGVVKSKTYKINGRYLTKSEAEVSREEKNLTIQYEKMSKSKGNGVDPQNLLESYGTDATRFCLMSYANPRTERLWRSDQEEFKDVLIFLRRVVLTVQEYQDLANVKELSELSDNELEIKKAQLNLTRNRCSVDAMYHIQETNQFRQYISVLHSLLGCIRSNLSSTAAYTVEFAECLASLIVMLNLLTPHLSEELWLHFSKCIMNPLRTSSISSFKLDLQAADQSWPIPDDDHPLAIKVKATNSDEYIKTIQVKKDQLRAMSLDDITRLVENEFTLKGDNCKVLEVKKFDDLLSIVIANVESINKKVLEKKKRRKQERGRSANKDE